MEKVPVTPVWPTFFSRMAAEQANDVAEAGEAALAKTLIKIGP